MAYHPINVTASRTIDTSHADAVTTINAAAGLTLTLPAASGTGNVYTFVIRTAVTSNSVVIRVANATDIMQGVAFQAADGGSTSNAWETAADSDTITFNGSTTGGLVGDRVILTDIASGVWQVQITGAATGTEATPFSAAVS